MALIGQTRVGIRETGNRVTIPADPRAKLMYYLDCMCSVLNLGSDVDPNINRLRRYHDYWLSGQQVDALLIICAMLEPRVLLNKCIFESEELCGDFGNNFFELSSVQDRFLVTQDILIGGQRKQVQKIMTFKWSWLNTNFVEPLKTLADRRNRERQEEQRRQERLRWRQENKKSSSCVIL